jgi:hypothetical protein
MAEDEQQTAEPAVQPGGAVAEVAEGPGEPLARGAGDAAQPQEGMDGQVNVQPSKEELAELRGDEVAFSWQASEYVHHNKGMNWYAGLAAGVAVLVGIAALTRQWIDIVLFAMVGAALVIYGRKPPRLMTYELTPKGIRIDGKDYMYSEFRSFGVLPDVEWHTIDLEPTQRFSPRITVLFSDDDFKNIVGHLELHLPRVDRKPDLVEQLTRYLRF